MTLLSSSVQICFNYNISLHVKTAKTVVTRHLSWPQNMPKRVVIWTMLGSLQLSPDFLAELVVAKEGKGGKWKESRQKNRGGNGERSRGEKGEGKEKAKGGGRREGKGEGGEAKALPHLFC